jgi:hypothetical protein
VIGGGTTPVSAREQGGQMADTAKVVINLAEWIGDDGATVFSY